MQSQTDASLSGRPNCPTPSQMYRQTAPESRTGGGKERSPRHELIVPMFEHVLTADDRSAGGGQYLK